MCTEVHVLLTCALLCTLCTLCTMCTFLKIIVHFSAHGNVQGCSMQRQASFLHSFMPPYISHCADLYCSNSLKTCAWDRAWVAREKCTAARLIQKSGFSHSADMRNFSHSADMSCLVYTKQLIWFCLEITAPRISSEWIYSRKKLKSKETAGNYFLNQVS